MPAHAPRETAPPPANWAAGEAPAGLPEGAELEMCIAEPDWPMSEEELAALNRALDDAWQSVLAGRVRPAADLVADLRVRR